MDLLINDIGPPPYQITVFESVLRDGQAMLARVRNKSVDVVSDSEITHTMERLEALASLCFRALEIDLITYTMNYSTTSMDGLAGVIWGLKQQLPAPGPRAGTGQDKREGDVCRFCGWALERIGVGVGGTSSLPDTLSELVDKLNTIQPNTSGPSASTPRRSQTATSSVSILGRTFRGSRHHPTRDVPSAAC